MERGRFIRGAFFLLAFLAFCPFSSYAASATNAGISLNIATADNRSISIDRLLYTAMRDAGIETAVMATASLQQGYTLANAGERDGVISATPNMEQLYPDLIKVPVALDYSNFIAFAREADGIRIESWNDLDGRSVGILTERVYISSQIPKNAGVTAGETTRAVLEGLERREYDVVVLSVRDHETLALPEGIAQAGVIETLPEYLYMHKSRAELLPDIEKALTDIFADGRGESILNDVPLPEMYRKRTVLHIISSTAELAREVQFGAELKKQFMEDASIEWYTVSLNSKASSGDSDRLAYFARLLRRDCVSRDIAAIIVSGEEALNFLTDYYFQFFRNTPILFYGMTSDQYKQMPEIEPYMTGMTETVAAYETVSAALSLFPNNKNIFVVTDYTDEALDYRAAIAEQLEPLSGRISVEYNEAADFDTLLSVMRELGEEYVVLFGPYYRDAAGQYFSGVELQWLLKENCKAPIFTLYSMEAGHNAIGGKLPDYKKYGEIVAAMLERLLDGENPGDIPVVEDSSEYNSWVFDQNMLDIWGISDRALPANAQVLNKTLSVWESNPQFTASLVVLFAVIIIAGIVSNVFISKYVRQKKNLEMAQALLNREEKIREVKERLELIINTVPAAYMLTLDGIVMEVNEYTRKHIGLHPGDDVYSIYTDVDQRDALIERSAKQGLVENQVIRFNMPGGKSNRFVANISAIEYERKAAHMLWAMDIEQDAIKTDQLMEAQQGLQTILDLLPVPVRVSDYNTKVLIYINKSCKELLEYDSDAEWYGKSVYDMMHEYQSDGTLSRDKILPLEYSAEPLVVEIEHITGKGNTIATRITVIKIDYCGIPSVISAIEDITAEREYQRMLRDTAEREKEANQLKSRFLVHMSHEIRTPMNIIIGLSEIELRKKLTQDNREVYKKINTSAKHLLEIINDILDLSKIEADKIELFDEEFELEELLSGAMLVASPRLEGKKVEFLLNTSFELPRYIIGDRTRLWQILKNFLDNSAKFTEQGKMVLTVFENKKMSDSDTIYICFIIEDTGIGMDGEQLQRVFLPYMQIYSEAQKKYTGTGLGMAISKQLCELMGGTLDVFSKPGEGTSAFITIPFKRSKNPDTELQAVKAPALADMHVLVVDDNELSLQIMSSLLEENDVKCEIARSGEEAIETIFEHRSRGKAFDIVLLDYMMGDLNGLETARQIQSGLSNVPKLLMVTSHQKEVIGRGIDESGIVDIIEKPFVPSHFIRKICSALGEIRNDEDSGTEEIFAKYENVHVLLVEDYKLNQEVAAGMFAQFGVTATIAENGRQGIDMLNSGEYFDLVFMDLQMPVMDGFDAAHIIRADPRFDEIPIISLSADAMKETVDKCMEAGINDNIAKPIEFMKLGGIFRKWLPESKRMAEEKGGKSILEPLNELQARFGGDRNKYEKALQEFAHDLPDEWPEFRDALSNIEETKRTVHGLKGIAGMLAITDIYDCAVEFENSMHRSDSDIDLYRQLVSLCNAFKISVAEEAKHASVIPTGAGTAEELRSHLRELGAALDNCNPKLCSDTIGALKEKTWPDIDEEKLRQLCELGHKYEFDAALKILDSIYAEGK